MGKICVIGGSNIDICGRSEKPLIFHDSNPGFITIRYGGVGRNIAELLCCLNHSVEFVSCFGDDTYGKAIYEDCIRKGIDCQKSKIISNANHSMYIALMDEGGELSLGMSDMRILDHFTKEDTIHAVHDLKKEDVLIIDSNLDEELIETALQNAHCQKVSDPVSVNKCIKLKPFLHFLDIFKPNQYEAEVLSGITIHNEENAKQSLDYFLDQGVKEIIISLAEKGVLLGTKEKKVLYQHRIVNVNNVTGGGDALLGMYLSKRMEEIEPFQAIQFAIASAITMIEKQELIHQDTLQQVIEQIKIKEIEL